MPALEQSAWELAKANAGAVYRSATFAISSSIAFLLAGAIAAAISFGGKSEEVAAAGVIAGLAGLLGCLGAVLAFQVAVAAVRQRNELREVLRRSVGEVEDPPVLVALTDYVRQGDDHLSVCKAAGYGTNDELWLEAWTKEVVAFLGRHCEQQSGRAFAQASKGSENFFERLERRLAALDQIIAATPNP